MMMSRFSRGRPPWRPCSTGRGRDAGKMLRYAHEVELIEVVPRVKLLKIPPQKFDF